MGKNYQYYVEGEDEEKIVKVLKTELRLIEPGKIEKFNVLPPCHTGFFLLDR